MRPEERVRLGHMLEAARLALAFLGSESALGLVRNQMMFWAVVKQLEIIGEAAAHVSPETRARIPALPWPEINGMRNRLVHAYMDIDVEILWNTVSWHLPEMISALAPFLEDSDPAL